MTTVHYGGQPHPRREAPRDNFEDIVINNHAGGLVVQRDEGLVEAVFLVAICVALLGAVPRVVKKERVPRICSQHQPLHVLQNGRLGWWSGYTRERRVVHQHARFHQRELDLLEHVQHSLHVIHAATQLSLLPTVVDANKKAFDTPRCGWTMNWVRLKGPYCTVVRRDVVWARARARLLLMVGMPSTNVAVAIQVHTRDSLQKVQHSFSPKKKLQVVAGLGESWFVQASSMS